MCAQTVPAESWQMVDRGSHLYRYCGHHQVGRRLIFRSFSGLPWRLCYVGVIVMFYAYVSCIHPNGLNFIH